MRSIRIYILLFPISILVSCSDDTTNVTQNQNYLIVHGVVDSIYNTTDSNQYHEVNVGNLMYVNNLHVNIKFTIYGKDTVDDSNEAFLISISYFIANTYYLYQYFGKIVDTIHVQQSVQLPEHFYDKSTNIQLFTMKKDNWLVCRDLEISVQN